MAKSKVIKVVDFFAKRLKESGIHLKKVVLFGSHARGKADEESDIDIVIISEDFRRKDIFDRVKLTKEAEVTTIKKFMIPLDVITMTPEEFESETSLIADYAKKGKIVYAA